MLARISKTLVQARHQSCISRNCFNVYRMMFSTQKDINRLRETARIADRVIKMIRSPFEVSELEKEAWNHESLEQQVERVYSYALAERIKDALMRLNTQQQSRKDVLELFTTGVEPPVQIFHQARIRSAMMGFKLVYCPNSIISRQIFSIMGPKIKGRFCESDDRLVLTGFKGISKTLSVSLLWHLVRLIDEYRFSQKGPQQQAIKKFNHPKIVYWSITFDDTQSDVWESLLNQLPELKNAFTVEEIINKQVKIKNFYLKNYGTEVNLSVDQINFLASQQRSLSAKKSRCLISKQKAKSYKKKRITQSWSESDQKQLQKIQFLMKLVKKISSKFNRTFYLSSMDIETEFLRKSDLAVNSSHTIVPVFEVKYAEKIYNDSSLIDLCHFFIFEFNEKVFKKNQLQVPKEQLIKAQKMCFQHLKEKLFKKNYFFTTFYNIFSEIKTFSIQQDPLAQVTADVKDYLLKKFTDFIERTTSDVKQQFYGHFLKNDKYDSMRKITALKLSEESLKMIKAENQHQNQLKKMKQKKQLQENQVNAKQLTKTEDNASATSLYSINLQKLNLNKTKARDVLPLTFFSYDDKQQVTLRLPVKLTYEMLEPKIQECLHFYLKNVNELMSSSMTTSGLASTIERLFVLALKKGDTSFTMSYKGQQGGRLSDFTKIYDTIKKGSYPFIPLNKKGSLSLLQCLRNSLQKMLDNQEKFAVLEPIIDKFAQQDLFDVQPHQLHVTSKGIDLIIAKLQTITPNHKRLYLDLIDITLQDSQNLIFNKMKDFLNIFFSLADKEAKSIELELTSSNITIYVQLNYFIFCQTNRQQSLLQKLKKAPMIKDQFQFLGSKEVNTFGVSLKNSKSSLLTQVGFISMEDNIQFIKGRQEKEVLSFKQAIQVLKKRRKQKKGTKVQK